MPSNKKEAIILSRRDFKESDRLICIYSLEEGKQTILAKGVRKPLSRLGGFLEQFSHVELVLAESKSLAIVNDSNILASFKNLRSDYKLVEKANEIAQVIQSFTKEEEENRELFKLLLESLVFLNQDLATDLILSYFYLNFLRLNGLAPSLDQCEACNCDLNKDQVYFGEPYNGFHCEDCKKESELQLSAEVAKLLRLIFVNDLSYLLRISGLKREHFEILNNLSRTILDYHHSHAI